MSHKTTAITTTAFKIDLIDPAIGTKLFTSQSRTPTTTRAISICNNGMIFPVLFAKFQISNRGSSTMHGRAGWLMSPSAQI